MKKTYWIIGIVIIIAVGAFIYFNTSEEPLKNRYEDDKGYPMVNSRGSWGEELRLESPISAPDGKLNFEFDEMRGDVVFTCANTGEEAEIVLIENYQPEGLVEGGWSYTYVIDCGDEYWIHLMTGASPYGKLFGPFSLLDSPEPTPNGDREYSEITYEDCADEILKELRTLGPANEEPIGTERTDDNERVWIKSDEINRWDSEGNPISGAYAWKSDSSLGSLLTSESIDEFPGGINYNPDESAFKECEVYIGTRNAKMEEGIREVINIEIENQKQKGIIISIEELHVYNLGRRSQAGVKLNCEEDIDSQIEEEIIGNIANALFEKYPNDYAEDSERNSWVDINCIYNMGWRLGYGSYGRKI
jgi:hypothetical protein